MSNEFERENRYIVLKRDHLAGLDDQLQARLKPAIDEAIQIMPRLDFLVVESDWPEYEPTWAAIEARVTGKPAEKNLGEPVELPNRKLHVHQGLSHTDAKVDGWNACLDEIAKLGPLYTHADPSDIRVTRQALESLKGEANDLRAQLADRDALLKEVLIKTDKWMLPDLYERIRLSLKAASAEPSAIADPHGCNKCTHPECGKFDGPHKVECRAMADNACARPDAEPSAPEEIERVFFKAGQDLLIGVKSIPLQGAPVEIDERAAFDAAYERGDFYIEEARSGFTYQDYRRHQAWAVWKVRAALERKPS